MASSLVKVVLGAIAMGSIPTSLAMTLGFATSGCSGDAYTLASSSVEVCKCVKGSLSSGAEKYFQVTCSDNSAATITVHPDSSCSYETASAGYVVLSKWEAFAAGNDTCVPGFDLNGDEYWIYSDAPEGLPSCSTENNCASLANAAHGLEAGPLSLVAALTIAVVGRFF
eukprot:CAMPEP_0206463782 /NCGR_PEP_ID=MMETSP0324_2-20121206/26813_1 /ASSEMBLY_ACC=CAM_ASM_000836 /TAXON_ID=2866 /ORGANISM="Crypthecodinium cohnii, Strain Seligo" /LENGTH=168 /DNA_ID=CAMNT_0053936263 /DNA_START=61 /DNA_END=567 /DNA_ORIENTATION=+